MDPRIEQLKTAARAAANERTWSQGVGLARDRRVRGTAQRGDEIELEVRVPTRATAFEVILDLEHQEWQCDCPGREAICSHVVGALLSLAVAAADGEAGAPAPLPTSPHVGGDVRYCIEPAGGGVTIERQIVRGDVVQRLTGSLIAVVTGRTAGPKIAATEADLTADKLLSARGGTVDSDKFERLLAVLASAKDVRWKGQPVTCSAEPLVARAIARDHGPDILLEIARPPELTEIVTVGVARVGTTLQPIAARDLVGARLEHLPMKHLYGHSQWPVLAAQVLPKLSKQLAVEVWTKRLPTLTRGEAPRIELQVTHEGDAISVLPVLVYGDPPLARVDGDRLVQLGNAIPVRDRDAERTLMWRLRDELNLAPGRRVDARGAEAMALSGKLSAWMRKDSKAASASVELTGTIDIDGTTLDLTFSGRERKPGAGETTRQAAADAVVRAWQVGAELVPLLGGGWGRVPRAWLDKHGARIADLLAIRDPDHKVPMHALPELAALCQDLDRPPPAELERLRPLLASFDGLPTPVVPPHVAVLLRPYQQLGVAWLSFCRDLGLGCVLADDMGLGKTVQAIATMKGKVLVICPTSVRFNWERELARFRPELRVATYHGSKRKLDAKAEVTVTTYPILRNDAAALAETPWDAVFFDESQAIKNPDSQVAQAAYGLRAKWRVTLSGTPVENRLDELWSQLHVTNPGLLGGRADFRDRWSDRIGAGDNTAAAQLRARIRPFVLRRLKREVAPELPPRTDAVMYVELDEQERVLYQAIHAATQREVMTVLAAGGGVMAALEALLRLRQASCHGALVPGSGVDRAVASSKLGRLLEAVSEAVSEGHKALVFSQWTSLLDLIEPHLRSAGIDFARLDGSTVDRGAVVERFQDAAGPPILLASLKAGGTGLNLTAADHVFLCDPWWNPAAEDQAADRAHRIGQDKPVMVYRLVARETVEERILLLQDKKRALAEVALGEAGAAAALTRDDLMALLA